MGSNVARKLIGSHLAAGTMTPGTEIGLRIDQTLTQDATGTMVMLDSELTVRNHSANADFTVRHRLSPRQVAMVLLT